MGELDELGITVEELIQILPTILSDVLEHYNDDQKIDASEGLLIVAGLLEELGAATDDPEFSELFVKQAEAFRALAVVLGS